MINIILFFGIIMLTIGIGSTVPMFIKLNKLRNRVQFELTELEKDLIDEIKQVGRLEQTTSGRELKELMKLEYPELFLHNKPLSTIQTKKPSFELLKAPLFVLGVVSLIFLLVIISPESFSQPIPLEFLLNTPLPSLLVIAGMIFLFLGTATVKKPIVVDVNSSSRKFAIVLGIILLGLGIALLFVVPTK